ncbi:MAG TPA: nuclear transport factor 2 family protein [Candidatus Dormibacteraeota bacterium]|nr:nuclear transport factor 2 family protein [Candidatus Dormibacteraeota bacterium]
MSQQVASSERTEQINEYDAIARVLELYMDGSAMGKADKLKEAFHPDARMFGAMGGKRIDIPIQTLIEMTAKGPADTAGRYRGRIISLMQVGDAAMAAVAEDGFWGSVSFVDFFNLAKVDGRWVIVNKTSAHTDGEPPSL